MMRGKESQSRIVKCTLSKCAKRDARLRRLRQRSEGGEREATSNATLYAKEPNTARERRVCCVATIQTKWTQAYATCWSPFILPCLSQSYRSCSCVRPNLFRLSKILSSSLLSPHPLALLAHRHKYLSNHTPRHSN